MSTYFKKKEIIGLMSVIVLSVLILFGLYIFNGGTFSTHSLITSDGRIGNLEFYYHLWDVIHEGDNLFFDWYSGFGTNLAGVISHSGINSVLNVVFFFVKRDQVFGTYSFLINLRFVLLAVSMYYFLSKTYKDQVVLAVLGALCYAFNYFTIYYSFFHYWMDIAIVFPLLMLFANKLLFEGKQGIIYGLLLAYLLMLDINLAPMIVFFVILYAGLSLYFNQDKECHITELILYSIGGSLISLVLLLPGFIQITKSSRVQESILSQIWQGYKVINYKNKDKWLFGCLPIVSICLGICNLKKKEDYSWLCLTIIMALAIVIEGSNLFWHMGKYEGFTMRFSFMMQFCSIVVLMNLTKVKKVIPVGLTLIMGIIAGLAFFKDSWSSCSNEVLTVFIILLMAVIGVLLAEKYQKVYFLSVGLVGMLFISNRYITLVENNSEYSILVTKLCEDVQDDSALNRVKWEDFIVSHNNYPQVVRRSAQSNFLHLIHNDQIEFSRHLGYLQPFTKLTDLGGTLISDALYNTSTYITKQYYPEEVAVKTGSIEDYDIYQVNNHQFGYYLYDTVEYQDDPLLMQNQVSKAICNKELLDITNETIYGDLYYEKEIKVDTPSYVYLRIIGPNSFHIYVDDELLVEGYENGMVQTQYEGVYIERQRELINLGYVEDSIKLKVENPSGPAYDLYLGVLPVDAYLKALEANRLAIEANTTKDTLEVKITADKDGKVVLPIFYDGFKGADNELFDNAFIVVPVHQGENTFNFKVKIDGMLIGIVSAVVGMIMLILLTYFNSKGNVFKPIQKYATIATYCAFGVLVLAMVVAPCGIFVLKILKNLLL